MNIQEKAEQYAREKHGRSASGGIDKVNSAQDYTTGYNEAKRWIPVVERLPNMLLNGKIIYVLCKSDTGFPFVGQYTGIASEFNVLGTSVVKCVKEWREI